MTTPSVVARCLRQQGLGKVIFQQAVRPACHRSVPHPPQRVSRGRAAARPHEESTPSGPATCCGWASVAGREVTASTISVGNLAPGRRRVLQDLHRVELDAGRGIGGLQPLPAHPEVINNNSEDPLTDTALLGQRYNICLCYTFLVDDINGQLWREIGSYV